MWRPKYSRSTGPTNDNYYLGKAFPMVLFLPAAILLWHWLCSQSTSMANNALSTSLSLCHALVTLFLLDNSCLHSSLHLFSWKSPKSSFDSVEVFLRVKCVVHAFTFCTFKQSALGHHWYLLFPCYYSSRKCVILCPKYIFQSCLDHFIFSINTQVATSWPTGQIREVQL